MPEPTPVVPAPQVAPQPAPEAVVKKPRAFSGAVKNWKFTVGFVILAYLFFGVQYAFQSAVLHQEEGFAAVRASAFAGATFLMAALVCSPLFKWKPVWARYWYVRRSFGVMGWVFIAFHFYHVLRVYMQFNVLALFTIINPLENPAIFGLAAFPIFSIMALTSCDLAVEKLGFTRWKTIHRLVYLASALSVFHFLTINPVELWTPPGYLLLGITALTLIGELYYFLRTVKKKGIKTKGSIIGFLVILFWIVLAILVYA